jgi:hypothetical protein
MLLKLIKKNKATSIIGSLIVGALISIAIKAMWPILTIVLICLLALV